MKFQDTGYTIKHVQQQIHLAMESALRPLSLSLSQYNVLKSLEALSSATGAQLARRAFISPQAMHTILITMERKKLITRVEISGNTKSFNVLATHEGEDALTSADMALTQLFANANAALASSEFNELERLLQKLSLGLKAFDSGDDNKKSELN